MFIDFFLRMVKLASKYQFVKIFSKMLLKLLLKEKKNQKIKMLRNPLFIGISEHLILNSGRGGRNRTHINGFGDRYLSLWTTPLCAQLSYQNK